MQKKILLILFILSWVQFAIGQTSNVYDLSVIHTENEFSFCGLKGEVIDFSDIEECHILVSKNKKKVTSYFVFFNDPRSAPPRTDPGVKGMGVIVKNDTMPEAALTYLRTLKGKGHIKSEIKMICTQSSNEKYPDYIFYIKFED